MSSIPLELHKADVSSLLSTLNIMNIVKVVSTQRDLILSARAVLMLTKAAIDSVRS